MKRPLVRKTSRPIQRRGISESGIKRRTAKFTPRKPLLHFAINNVSDPLDGVDRVNGTHEQVLKRELDAVGSAFRKASTDIKNRYTLAGYGIDYCVLVFKDTLQVTAFLAALGYPQPKDHYIDGTVLADILQIQLPESAVRITKLKRAHNPRLTSLAQPMVQTKGTSR